MSSFHALVGLVIVGSWAVVCFWSLALRLLRIDDTPTFWRAVSAAQILLAIEFLVGLALLVAYAIGRGELPGDGSAFDVTFHLLYGIVFPLVVLVIGHRVARDGRYDAHSVFSVVGLVIFGLTARAWMVGAGVG